MYTIKEFAEIFKVSEMTVKRWIKKGDVKPTKIGGTVRISDEEIERLKRGEDFERSSNSN